MFHSVNSYLACESRFALIVARECCAGVLRGSGAVPAGMPAELAAALRASPGAKAAFARMSPSHQRQWQQYVGEAKQTETRQRRAARAVAQLVAGSADPRAL